MTRALRQLLTHALLVLAAALQLACQTPSAPTSGGLSEHQIVALMRAGFTLSDDGWSLSLDGPILFASNDDHLSEQAYTGLRQLSETLRSVGIDRVRVEGHADNTGSESHNQALSARRAEVVARAMADHGIPYENIKRRAMGSIHPIADNDTPEGRAQNRRVAIIVPAD